MSHSLSHSETPFHLVGICDLWDLVCLLATTHCWADFHGAQATPPSTSRDRNSSDNSSAKNGDLKPLSVNRCAQKTSIHPKINMTGWKNTIFYRKYIFIHGWFSIVMLVFGEVSPEKCWDWKTLTHLLFENWPFEKVTFIHFRGGNLVVHIGEVVTGGSLRNPRIQREITAGYVETTDLTHELIIHWLTLLTFHSTVWLIPSRDPSTWRIIPISKCTWLITTIYKPWKGHLEGVPQPDP